MESALQWPSRCGEHTGASSGTAAVHRGGVPAWSSGSAIDAVARLIGKRAVVKHHKDVPFRLLEPVAALSCGDPDSGNLIVQGDNLDALKALLPRYAGQVKCIYIDPPYNTGNEGWVYNDNVNSPEIRRWLGEVVGKEGETLDRHDRWLCMMYPRLVLLKQFCGMTARSSFLSTTTKLATCKH